MQPAILFDLDGTLLDTAPDLLFALNQLLCEQGLHPITLKDFKPIASLGSKILLRKLFGIDEMNPAFHSLRERFFTLYQNHIADNTCFFPKMDHVLDQLDENNIPWGIVTNKLTQHTFSLLKALKIHDRAKCIVCGDTLMKSKPDPLPLLHASRLLQLIPSNCLYVGDTFCDVTASKAAGMQSIVALYGYTDHNLDPHAWLADGYIKTPVEILDLLP